MTDQTLKDCGTMRCWLLRQDLVHLRRQAIIKPIAKRRLIRLKVLVGLLVPMLKEGEAERRCREGVTVATEVRRHTGGVALMGRGRCAMPAVYVSVRLVFEQLISNYL